MVRHADTEMIVMKEDIYTHGILETEGMAHHAGPCGEGPEWVRRQEEERGEDDPELLLGFLREGMGEVG